MNLAEIKQRLAIGRVTMDDAEALVREIEHARVAIGPAWILEGASTADAITRKCAWLEKMASTPSEETRALSLARDALDRMMGDTDLDDDDSIEMRAMRAIARALERGEGAER